MRAGEVGWMDGELFGERWGGGGIMGSGGLRGLDRWFIRDLGGGGKGLSFFWACGVSMCFFQDRWRQVGERVIWWFKFGWVT